MVAEISLWQTVLFGATVTVTVVDLMILIGKSMLMTVIFVPLNK